MKFYCPSCGKVVIVDKTTIELFQSFFAKSLLVESLSFLCDGCGDRILNNYRDIHGIGV